MRALLLLCTVAWLLASPPTIAATAVVTWTAPGDDQYWGAPAASYEVTLNGEAVPGIPAPGQPGGTDSLVMDLPYGTHWLSIAAVDDAGNMGEPDTVKVIVLQPTFDCADVTRDGRTNIQDVTTLVAILWRGASCPDVTNNTSWKR